MLQPLKHTNQTFLYIHNFPNFQNDMWRIIGLVFFDEKDYFLTEDKKSFCESRIRSFLIRKGIALTDSGREVIRQKDNASDKFLEIVGTIDLSEVLKCLPECEAIVTTGQKATDTLLTMIEAQQPGVGQAVEFVYDGRKLRLYRMPSSSRALGFLDRSGPCKYVAITFFVLNPSDKSPNLFPFPYNTVPKFSPVSKVCPP